MWKSHGLAVGCATTLLFAVHTAGADEPALPASPRPPLEQDASPVPPVARPAPAPVPEPRGAEQDGDSVLGPHFSHGGYGAPSLKMTTMAGDGAMLVGGEGGWIIGRTIVIGAAGYGSVTNVVSPAALQPPSGDARLSLSYGGFRLGGVLRAQKVTHLTFGVLIGGGSATSETASGSFRRTDGFFVIEPDLAAEINMARHVRLAIGGSYRFADGTDVAGFTSTRLSGPAAMLALRFGSF